MLKRKQEAQIVGVPLPVHVHSFLKEEARKNYVSVNDKIRMILKKYMDDKKKMASNEQK